MARHKSNTAAPGLPRGHVVHRSPGRTRLRMEGHRHDQPFFEHLSERLRQVPGVASVDCNAETGSVLIHHAGGAGSLLDHARESSILMIARQGSVLHSLAKAMDSFTLGLDRQLRRSTGNQVSLPLFLSFVFLLMAAAKLAQGDFRSSTVHLLLSALQGAASRHAQERPGEEEEEMVQAIGQMG